MAEEENKPKESIFSTVKVKRILLESSDNHRMWMDVLSTGEIILHEMFGVPAAEPTTLAEMTAQTNSCYHVTIAIKEKYVDSLVNFLRRDDLFVFETKESDAPSERATD